MIKKKIVFVAMSGGVDSSVAAALLKKRGFDVIGVFMKNWGKQRSYSGQRLRGVAGPGCFSQDDFESAASAATALDIPFYSWNLEEEYKRRVFDYMLREYMAGRTPNPDVMCNKEIKFGAFFERAIAAGADFVATGHYARKKLENRKWKLVAGFDSNKDQSYFLWTLSQKHLARTLFPIGEYAKAEVRKLAREAGLPNAERPDSQGLCFIGKVDFTEFLKEYLPPRTGAVVTVAGRVLGEHKGAHYYTLGQRHGLGLGGGVPYYVAAKDAKSNTLVVAQGADDQALFRRELEADNVNWISGFEPEFPLRCLARIRYRQALQNCMLTRMTSTDANGNTDGNECIRGDSCGLADSRVIRVCFDKAQRAVAPGQSVVFYQGDDVVGGGVIAG